MAKGLIAGMTDYDHQSFEDIINDLKDEKLNMISYKDEIEKNVNLLIANNYWTNVVPSYFRNMIQYSLKHFSTTITELNDIAAEIEIEVQLHHVNRLQKIAEVANKINLDIGNLWHQDYENKQYGNANFDLVETIYADTRNTAVTLLDLSNLAYRLKDFIGKSKIVMNKNNPWISGSFYLFVTLLIIIVLATIASYVHWALIPLIIIGGILIICTIGAFQLKNDDKLSDKSFLDLMQMTLKNLPLIKNLKK